MNDTTIGRYIVRVRMGGDDALFGQAPTAGLRSVVVRAQDAGEALRLGAAQMGKPEHRLEVVKMEDSGTTIPVLVSPEQIQRVWEQRGDQDTRYAGPA